MPSQLEQYCSQEVKTAAWGSKNLIDIVIVGGSSKLNLPDNILFLSI